MEGGQWGAGEGAGKEGGGVLECACCKAEDCPPPVVCVSSSIESVAGWQAEAWMELRVATRRHVSGYVEG
jgi:hypothetical protein